MSKWRKKPIVLEAFQWHVAMGTVGGVIYPYHDDADIDFDQLHGGRCGMIETLEGGFVVEDGDWVITGIKGEKYSCKAEIFPQLYEPVDEIITPTSPML